MVARVALQGRDTLVARMGDYRYVMLPKHSFHTNTTVSTRTLLKHTLVSTRTLPILQSMPPFMFRHDILAGGEVSVSGTLHRSAFLEFGTFKVLKAKFDEAKGEHVHRVMV